MATASRPIALSSWAAFGADHADAEGAEAAAVVRPGGIRAWRRRRSRRLFFNPVAIKQRVGQGRRLVMGVKTGCAPRSDVLQGELNDAIFAAST
jgi:hypothetical protein